MEKIVLCELEIAELYPWLNGDNCNVYCKAPDGSGAAFFSRTSKLKIGQKLVAARLTNAISTWYEVLPFWDGEKETHPFEI